ncbi:hypothetical protein [Campylobacter canadensis]|uniref:Uncharacterized protein n=1 Tax=Campylobacter canadensis TaxID=449520 RepID=A0ABS7WT24_9BACT|nr:hypothetical protein [Campylobacter canadensis]MBZ7987930.1 hypothetical protein [Campylobacter canadensis]MBZ7995405.1 hypothetical protein [Campylobacter canadensis]MBZ7997049.1 hypothetical protein [Campylobacter canadensis]MBZ7998903.1 hypothetical protein [Campylobacter canadensis]MBZ8000582.1 hypothetical protein [Campylobacter canadensis]
MKNYQESNSLKESLEILKRYKNDVSKEDYENIKSTICSHAIENIYADELSIIIMIKSCVFNLNNGEILDEYKEKGYVDYERK